MSLSRLDQLPSDIRREVMEEVARAYVAGVPVTEFMQRHPDCPLPHFHIYKLYKSCLAKDGESAPRCKYCADKRVGHRGVCRVEKNKEALRASVYKRMIREIPMLAPEFTDAACPCCHQQINREMVAIDLNSNVLAYNGRAWKVKPQLCVFVYTLARSWPKAVSANDMIFALWGAVDEPDTAMEILKQYASRFRALFSGTGVELRRGPRAGSYSLWLPSGGGVLPGSKENERADHQPCLSDADRGRVDANHRGDGGRGEVRQGSTHH